MTNSSITEMSTSMTQTLNADLATRGALYAAGLNADLAKVQKVLDDDIFGGGSRFISVRLSLDSSSN